MQRRVCALVLGMHRSGTSCVAGALAQLGFAPPAQLIGANPANPKGHWEATPVARFNDRILEFAGSDWRDWAELNLNWHNSPYHDRFVEEGVTILNDMFGDAPMIVLKDPRICRLTDVWRDILRREGFSTITFMPLRHPAEVSASLAVRNQINPTQAQFLWLRYMLDAERETRRTRRFMFRYVDFVCDWRGMLDRARSRADAIFPRLNDTTAATVDTFVDQALYRNRLNDDGHALLHPLVAEAYAIFSAWSDGDENPGDYERLDEIEVAFTALGRRVRPIFAAFDNIQTQLDTLGASASRQKCRVDEVLTHLVTSNAANGNATTDLQAVFVTQSTDLNGLITAVSALSERLLDSEHGLLGEFAGLIADDVGSARDFSATRNALTTAENENSQLRDEVGALRNHAELLQAEVESQTSAALAIQHAQQQSEAEAAMFVQQATATIGDLEVRVSVLASELEQKRAETDQIYAERDALQDQVAGLEAELASAAEREREYQANLDRTSGEFLHALDDVVAISHLLRNAEQANVKLAAENQSRKDAAQQMQAQERKIQSLQSQIEVLREQLEIKVQERRALRTKKEQADEKLIKLRAEHAQLQATSTDLKEALAESKAKMASLSEQLARKVAGKTEADRKLHKLRHRQDALIAQNSENESKRKAAEQKARTDHLNIAHAASILERMASEKLSFPRPSHRSDALAKLPGTPLWRWKRFCTKLAAQGAFDPNAYLLLNPDVAASGVDPLVHYLTKGQAERRPIYPHKNA